VQKFGLQRNSLGQPNAIELELAKEQATSLGRAGRKLQLSLETYNKMAEEQPDALEDKAMIKEISDNVWELMLQREFVGFIDGNLEWVKDNYFIPEEAIKLLGK